MSKARILANLISDNAELADGQISVAEVVGAAPLASPTFTGTASGTFSGPLTGNVTGNLTGDVTGAVTGDVTAPEIDLSAISATIADTAVDVFVYDTSKDSDGGAWRKRTQATSWYNETLNTATRGSRKEFPAVAVIVAESDTVTIYDGDDPDLPMWMVFNTSSSAPADYAVVRSGGVGADISSASALNGITSLPVSYNGFFYQNFVTDDCYRVNTSSTIQGGNIAARNGGMNFSNTVGSYGIVQATVNDVAMTVLPNAPIDAATGLPVPTIAVATEGGVSVIRDDGTVVDITPSSSGFGSVDFFDERLVYSYGEGGVVNQRVGIIDSIPSADTSSNSSQYAGMLEPTVDPTNPKLLSSAVDSGGATAQYVAHDADGFSVGVPYYVSNSLQRLGVTRVLHNSTSISNSSVAYITSDYNTGWMNGDIKLATLSDTDDTDVTGSELVTNGTFDTDTSGWTAGNNSTLSVSGGALVVTNGGSYGYADQSVSLVAGVYTLSADMTGGSVTGRVRIGTTAFGGEIVNGGIKSATSKHIYTFTLTSTTTVHFSFGVQSTTVGAFTKWDNVSVRLAEEDRSVNGNGLQVFGTVPKSAVTSGADLVAYGGFSNDNYLQQPYNSDLNFGTGDFCVMGWVNVGSNTSHQGLLNRDTLGATGAGLLVEYRYDVAAILFQPRDGTNVANSFTTTGSVGLNRWIFFVGVRDSNGTVQRLYLDGELNQTVSVSALNLDSTTAITRLGREVNQGRNYSGKMALWRISATAPSAEQIAKIYNDEKHLFQDGAQATLYGTSDAVTALAHDDTTDLLHVGTSAGRSVFQGLRRVDNTTDAVGAAISASNGLVAED